MPWLSLLQKRHKSQPVHCAHRNLIVSHKDPCFGQVVHKVRAEQRERESSYCLELQQSTSKRECHSLSPSVSVMCRDVGDRKITLASQVGRQKCMGDSMPHGGRLVVRWTSFLQRVSAGWRGVLISCQDPRKSWSGAISLTAGTWWVLKEGVGKEPLPVKVFLFSPRVPEHLELVHHAQSLELGQNHRVLV